MQNKNAVSVVQIDGHLINTIEQNSLRWYRAVDLVRATGIGKSVSDFTAGLTGHRINHAMTTEGGTQVCAFLSHEGVRICLSLRRAAKIPGTPAYRIAEWFRVRNLGRQVASVIPVTPSGPQLPPADPSAIVEAMKTALPIAGRLPDLENEEEQRTMLIAWGHTIGKNLVLRKLLDQQTDLTRRAQAEASALRLQLEALKKRPEIAAQPVATLTGRELSLTDVAKQCGIQRSHLSKWLKDKHYAFVRDEALVPFAEHQHSGLFTLTSVPGTDGRNHDQLMICPRGVLMIQNAFRQPTTAPSKSNGAAATA